MLILSKYLSVFLLGVLELWAAIPAGLAFKFNPVSVILFSAAGASTGAILVLVLGEPLRQWLLKLKKTNIEKTDNKFKKIWDKYGIPGLCLVSPILFGAHLGAAIGLSFGGKKFTIAIWMTFSCFLWATLFTILGTMGISLFHKG